MVRKPLIVLARSIAVNALPLIALVAAASSWYYHKNVSTYFNVLKNSEVNLISRHQKLIAEKINASASDLAFLAMRTESSISYADNKPIFQKELQALFFSFCRSKKIYDQVRFLDATGMEIIRVNYNKGNPVIVPEEKLQFKGRRYYFTDTIKLAPGSIFISPLDLNIENGTVEKPFKPMIRLGMQIFGKSGKPTGVILLNYLGAELLNDLSALKKGAEGESMLLNRDGYWLKAGSPAREWGFMFEGKKNLTFFNQFPDSWQEISDSESGQFRNQEGLFTFSTIYPVSEGLKTSAGSAEAFAQSSHALNPRQYYWKIVSYIDPLTVSIEPEAMFRRIFFVNLFFFVIILLRSYALSTSRFKRKAAEKELRLAHERMLTILDGLDGIVYVIDLSSYKILFANHYAKNILGNIVGRVCWKAIHSKDMPCDECPTYGKEIPVDWSATWEVLYEKSGHWYENRDRCITWLDGELVKIQIATDITRHKLLAAEREKLIADLSEAINQIKTLRGIVPICSNCKKIRDDKGYWNNLEEYIAQHSDASFSHGMCPECSDDLYGNEGWYIKMKKDQEKK